MSIEETLEVPALEKNAETQKELPAELQDFYEKMPQSEESKKRNEELFGFLQEKDPAALEMILESTKDAREVLDFLQDRALDTLGNLRVDLKFVKENWHTWGFYATEAGLEKAKQEATPEVLTNKDGATFNVMPEKYSSINSWKDLNDYLLRSNRFEGLSEQQIDEILEAEQDLRSAHSIRNEVDFQLTNAALNREVDRQSSEYEESLGKKPSASFIHEMSYKKELLNARLYGKMQKLRFAPKFAGDQVDTFVNNLSEDFKALFKKEKGE